MTAPRYDEMIVHVGQHKTGTTHVQKSLSSNADYLLSRGLFYPVPREGVSGHHSLVRQFRDSADDKLKKSFFGEQGDDARILSALETHTHARVAILSSEALLPHFGANIEKMHALDDRLRSLARQVRYVAYVRDPVSRYPSVCSQTLMNSSIIPVRDWALNAKHLVKLRAELGSRLEIRMYDRAAFPGGDILEDFLGGVVRTDIRATDLTMEESRSNVSLSGEGMFLVQSIAIIRQMADPKMAPLYDEETRAMAQLIRRIDSTQDDHAGARLLPGAADVILAAVADDLAQLVEIFDADLIRRASTASKRTDAGLRLVRSFFQVDPERTARLAELIRSHPRCSKALADLLGRVQMPST